MMPVRYLLRDSALTAAMQFSAATNDTELASYLRCSPRTLRAWRTGQACPNVAGLLRLRKLTGWDLEDLVYEVCEPAETSSRKEVL